MIRGLREACQPTEEISELPERRLRAAPALSTNSTEKRLPERLTQKPLSPASLMLLPQEGG